MKFYKFFSDTQEQWYLLKISKVESEFEKYSDPDYIFTFECDSPGEPDLYDDQNISQKESNSYKSKLHRNIVYYTMWRIDYEASFMSQEIEKRVKYLDEYHTRHSTLMSEYGENIDVDDEFSLPPNK